MRAGLLPSLALLVVALAVPAGASAPRAPPTTQSVLLNGHRFLVQIAVTPMQHARGLMGRTSMPADHGMLFVFPNAARRTFWMKNTLIPLDILFFDNRRALVEIYADTPPCTAVPCPLYPSDVPIRYALELNAGTAARLGLHTGDVLTLPEAPSGAP